MLFDLTAKAVEAGFQPGDEVLALAQGVVGQDEFVNLDFLHMNAPAPTWLKVVGGGLGLVAVITLLVALYRWCSQRQQEN